LRAARVRTPSGRYRLLRILAAFDVFCECADGRFENTELSKTLCSEMTTVVGAYDFAGITTFVNVGGGHEQCINQNDFTQLFARTGFSLRCVALTAGFFERLGTYPCLV
jgi:hypothetical protein